MIVILMAILAVLLAGCQTYVPVALEEPPVPQECKRRHARDLAPVPEMQGPTVTPDQINRHWAKHFRLKARARYRSLRQDYEVCSKYARRDTRRRQEP